MLLKSTLDVSRTKPAVRMYLFCNRIAPSSSSLCLGPFSKRVFCIAIVSASSPYTRGLGIIFYKQDKTLLALEFRERTIIITSHVLFGM